MNIFRILLTLCLCMATACNAQSFDCAKASSSTENTICDSTINNYIPELDVILSRTYKHLSAIAINRDALQADQKRWLAKRNLCKDSDECIQGSYEKRIKTLEDAWTKRTLALDRATWNKASQSTKPFEGEWFSCFLWKGDKICTGYRLVQSGKQVCGEWDEWATNRTYSGQLQAVAQNLNQVELKLICGTPGGEISTECLSRDPKGGWEKAKGGLSVCGNRLFSGLNNPCSDEKNIRDAFKYRALTENEIRALTSQAWAKSCLAEANTSVKADLPSAGRLP